MILWKEYNEENLDKMFYSKDIGISPEDIISGHRYSKMFLVYVKFNYPDAIYEPRFAHIIYWDDSYSIDVLGMSGNIHISHYSQINIPKL